VSVLPGALHANDNLSADDGAQIRLITHPDDRILGITLKVRSIGQAAEWLSGQGLLASESAGTVQIAPDGVKGSEPFSWGECH